MSWLELAHVLLASYYQRYVKASPNIDELLREHGKCKVFSSLPSFKCQPAVTDDLGSATHVPCRWPNL